MVKITSVDCGSLASGSGILAGDVLISINGNEINDVLDYRFYLTESEILLKLNRGEASMDVKIVKGEYDDIGLNFETPLMDSKQTCKNKCIFCFIDQNPKGLRDTLYFKDDDSRLSFLHGNYITLTNMTDKDVERIVKMRFSPINISVHTTNPELRVKMMKNKRAGDVLRYLQIFKDAGLTICAQIVLCKGINDGRELARSLNDLSKYFPELSSLAVVPAGLTKYRDGLYPLADFTSEEAGAVIDLIDDFAKNHRAKTGTRLVYAADEFYLKAGRRIPDSRYYEDYSQIENGVGMLRSFYDEADAACMTAEIDSSKTNVSGEKRRISVATGVASYEMMCDIAKKIEGRFPHVRIKIHKILNRFFGESITVSGLLTGRDIREQLCSLDLGDELLIPKNALRHGEEVFLCGMTLSELSDSLHVSVRACDSNGYELVDLILGHY